ncbi:nuclear GTPase SLIP-GC isoform X2 [Pleurodeles waltl]|uniref:nuclear GTPase SLIP-GC isoform X2 n=1 Tax=Pleurodeles waltl TaxID=8319 RepID=UPI0037099813
MHDMATPAAPGFADHKGDLPPRCRHARHILQRGFIKVRRVVKRAGHVQICESHTRPPRCLQCLEAAVSLFDWKSTDSGKYHLRAGLDVRKMADDVDMNSNEMPRFHLRRIGRQPSVEGVASYIHFDKVTTLIGRNRDVVDYFISCPTASCKDYISRVHARVVRIPPLDTHKIVDSSLTGIYINDLRIQGGVSLQEGDTVTFGHPQSGSIVPGTKVRQPNSESYFLFERCLCLGEHALSLSAPHSSTGISMIQMPALTSVQVPDLRSHNLAFVKKIGFSVLSRSVWASQTTNASNLTFTVTTTSETPAGASLSSKYSLSTLPVMNVCTSSGHESAAICPIPDISTSPGNAAEMISSPESETLRSKSPEYDIVSSVAMLPHFSHKGAKPVQPSVLCQETDNDKNTLLMSACEKQSHIHETDFEILPGIQGQHSQVADPVYPPQYACQSMGIDAKYVPPISACDEGGQHKDYSVCELTSLEKEMKSMEKIHLTEGVLQQLNDAHINVDANSFVQNIPPISTYNCSVAHSETQQVEEGSASPSILEFECVRKENVCFDLAKQTTDCASVEHGNFTSARVGMCIKESSLGERMTGLTMKPNHAGEIVVTGTVDSTDKMNIHQGVSDTSKIHFFSSLSDHQKRQSAVDDCGHIHIISEAPSENLEGHAVHRSIVIKDHACHIDHARKFADCTKHLNCAIDEMTASQNYPARLKGGIAANAKGIFHGNTVDVIVEPDDIDEKLLRGEIKNDENNILSVNEHEHSGSKAHFCSVESLGSEGASSVDVFYDASCKTETPASQFQSPVDAFNAEEPCYLGQFSETSVIEFRKSSEVMQQENMSASEHSKEMIQTQIDDDITDLVALFSRESKGNLGAQENGSLGKCLSIHVSSEPTSAEHGSGDRSGHSINQGVDMQSYSVFREHPGNKKKKAVLQTDDLFWSDIDVKSHLANIPRTLVVAKDCNVEASHQREVGTANKQINSTTSKETSPCAPLLPQISSDLRDLPVKNAPLLIKMHPRPTENEKETGLLDTDSDMKIMHTSGFRESPTKDSIIGNSNAVMQNHLLLSSLEAMKNGASVSDKFTVLSNGTEHVYCPPASLNKLTEESELAESRTSGLLNNLCDDVYDFDVLPDNVVCTPVVQTHFPVLFTDQDTMTPPKNCLTGGEEKVQTCDASVFESISVTRIKMEEKLKEPFNQTCILNMSMPASNDEIKADSSELNSEKAFSDNIKQIVAVQRFEEAGKDDILSPHLDATHLETCTTRREGIPCTLATPQERGPLECASGTPSSSSPAINPDSFTNSTIKDVLQITNLLFSGPRPLPPPRVEGLSSLMGTMLKSFSSMREFKLNDNIEDETEMEERNVSEAAMNIKDKENEVSETEVKENEGKEEKANVVEAKENIARQLEARELKDKKNVAKEIDTMKDHTTEDASLKDAENIDYSCDDPSKKSYEKNVLKSSSPQCDSCLTNTQHEMDSPSIVLPILVGKDVSEIDIKPSSEHLGINTGSTQGSVQVEKCEPAHSSLILDSSENGVGVGHLKHGIKRTLELGLTSVRNACRWSTSSSGDHISTVNSGMFSVPEHDVNNILSLETCESLRNNERRLHISDTEYVNKDGTPHIHGKKELLSKEKSSKEQHATSTNRNVAQFEEHHETCETPEAQLVECVLNKEEHAPKCITKRENKFIPVPLLPLEMHDRNIVASSFPSTSHCELPLMVLEQAKHGKVQNEKNSIDADCQHNAKTQDIRQRIRLERPPELRLAADQDNVNLDFGDAFKVSEPTIESEMSQEEKEIVKCQLKGNDCNKMTSFGEPGPPHYAKMSDFRIRDDVGTQNSLSKISKSAKNAFLSAPLEVSDSATESHLQAHDRILLPNCNKLSHDFLPGMLASKLQEDCDVEIVEPCSPSKGSVIDSKMGMVDLMSDKSLTFNEADSKVNCSDNRNIKRTFMEAINSEDESCPPKKTCPSQSSSESLLLADHNDYRAKIVGNLVREFLKYWHCTHNTSTGDGQVVVHKNGAQESGLVALLVKSFFLKPLNSSVSMSTVGSLSDKEWPKGHTEIDNWKSISVEESAINASQVLKEDRDFRTPGLNKNSSVDNQHTIDNLPRIPDAESLKYEKEIIGIKYRCCDDELISKDKSCLISGRLGEVGQCPAKQLDTGSDAVSNIYIDCEVKDEDCGENQSFTCDESLHCSSVSQCRIQGDIKDRDLPSSMPEVRLLEDNSLSKNVINDFSRMEACRLHLSGKELYSSNNHTKELLPNITLPDCAGSNQKKEHFEEVALGYNQTVCAFECHTSVHSPSAKLCKNEFDQDSINASETLHCLASRSQPDSVKSSWSVGLDMDDMTTSNTRQTVTQNVAFNFEKSSSFSLSEQCRAQVPVKQLDDPFLYQKEAAVSSQKGAKNDNIPDEDLGRCCMNFKFLECLETQVGSEASITKFGSNLKQAAYEEKIYNRKITSGREEMPDNVHVSSVSIEEVTRACKENDKDETLKVDKPDNASFSSTLKIHPPGHEMSVMKSSPFVDDGKEHLHKEYAECGQQVLNLGNAKSLVLSASTQKVLEKTIEHVVLSSVSSEVKNISIAHADIQKSNVSKELQEQPSLEFSHLEQLEVQSSSKNSSSQIAGGEQEIEVNTTFSDQAVSSESGWSSFLSCSQTEILDSTDNSSVSSFSENEVTDCTEVLRIDQKRTIAAIGISCSEANCEFSDSASSPAVDCDRIEIDSNKDTFTSNQVSTSEDEEWSSCSSGNQLVIFEETNKSLMHEEEMESIEANEKKQETCSPGIETSDVQFANRKSCSKGNLEYETINASWTSQLSINGDREQGCLTAASSESSTSQSSILAVSENTDGSSVALNEETNSISTDSEKEESEYKEICVVGISNFEKAIVTVVDNDVAERQYEKGNLSGKKPFTLDGDKQQSAICSQCSIQAEDLPVQNEVNSGRSSASEELDKSSFGLSNQIPSSESINDANNSITSAVETSLDDNIYIEHCYNLTHSNSSGSSFGSPCSLKSCSENIDLSSLVIEEQTGSQVSDCKNQELHYEERGEIGSDCFDVCHPSKNLRESEYFGCSANVLEEPNQVRYGSIDVMPHSKIDVNSEDSHASLCPAISAEEMEDYGDIDPCGNQSSESYSSVICQDSISNMNVRKVSSISSEVERTVSQTLTMFNETPVQMGIHAVVEAYSAESKATSSVQCDSDRKVSAESSFQEVNNNIDDSTVNKDSTFVQPVNNKIKNKSVNEHSTDFKSKRYYLANQNVIGVSSSVDLDETVSISDAKCRFNVSEDSGICSLVSGELTGDVENTAKTFSGTGVALDELTTSKTISNTAAKDPTYVECSGNDIVYEPSTVFCVNGNEAIECNILHATKNLDDSSLNLQSKMQTDKTVSGTCRLENLKDIEVFDENSLVARDDQEIVAITESKDSCLEVTKSLDRGDASQPSKEGAIDSIVRSLSSNICEQMSERVCSSTKTAEQVNERRETAQSEKALELCDKIGEMCGSRSTALSRVSSAAPLCTETELNSCNNKKDNFTVSQIEKDHRHTDQLLPENASYPDEEANACSCSKEEEPGSGGYGDKKEHASVFQHKNNCECFDKKHVVPSDTLSLSQKLSRRERIFSAQPEDIQRQEDGLHISSRSVLAWTVSRTEGQQLPPDHHSATAVYPVDSLYKDEVRDEDQCHLLIEEKVCDLKESTVLSTTPLKRKAKGDFEDCASFLIKSQCNNVIVISSDSEDDKTVLPSAKVKPGLSVKRLRRCRILGNKGSSTSSVPQAEESHCSSLSSGSMICDVPKSSYSAIVIDSSEEEQSVKMEVKDEHDDYGDMSGGGFGRQGNTDLQNRENVLLSQRSSNIQSEERQTRESEHQAFVTKKVVGSSGCELSSGEEHIKGNFDLNPKMWDYSAPRSPIIPVLSDINSSKDSAHLDASSAQPLRVEELMNRKLPDSVLLPCVFDDDSEFSQPELDLERVYSSDEEMSSDHRELVSRSQMSLDPAEDISLQRPFGVLPQHGHISNSGTASDTPHLGSVDHSDYREWAVQKNWAFSEQDLEFELKECHAVLHEIEQVLIDIQGVEDGHMKQWSNTILNLKEQTKEPSKTYIAVVGDTGSGKSSLLNALLDEEAVLPTSGMQACTAVVVEIARSSKENKYKAEVEFLSEEEWDKELVALIKDMKDKSGKWKKRRPDRKSEAGTAYCRVKAVYGRIAELSELKHMREVTCRLGRTEYVSADTAEKFSKKIQKYIDSCPDDMCYWKGGQLWPIVKCVKIYVPNAEVLKTGAVLVDLPGVRDSNAARDCIAREYLKKCHAVWVVAQITRAVDDKTAKELLNESLRRQLYMDGQYDGLAFICTKTDTFFKVEIKRALSLDKQLSPLESKVEALENQIKVMRRDIKDLDDQLHTWKSQSNEENPVYFQQGVAVDLRDHLMKLEREKISMEQEKDQILGEISLICVKSRNNFSKARIQSDFNSGLQEMKKKNAENEDEDEESSEDDEEEGVCNSDTEEKGGTPQRRLHVFTVSSTEYLKLRGKLQHEEPAKVFTKEEETEIPALKVFAIQTALQCGMVATEKIIRNVASITSHVISYLTNQKTQDETLQAQIKDIVQNCLADVREMLQAVVKKSIGEFSECFDVLIGNELNRGVEKAKGICEEKVQRWGSQDAGGYSYPTYKAVCSRQGVYTSVAYGPIDFNEQLSEPLVNSITLMWKEVFSDKLFCCLKSFSNAVWRRLDLFFHTLKDKLQKLNIETERFDFIRKQQLEEWNAVLHNFVLDQNEYIKNRQREISRILTPDIQRSMSQAYTACDQESGTGSFHRMKGHMLGHVRAHKSTMFSCAANKLMEQLGLLRDDIRACFEDVIEKLFDSLEMQLNSVLTPAKKNEDIIPDLKKIWDNVTKICERSCVDFFLPEFDAPGADPSTEKEVLQNEKPSSFKGKCKIVRIEKEVLPYLITIEVSMNRITLTRNEDGAQVSLLFSSVLHCEVCLPLYYLILHISAEVSRSMFSLWIKDYCPDMNPNLLIILDVPQDPTPFRMLMKFISAKQQGTAWFQEVDLPKGRSTLKTLGVYFSEEQDSVVKRESTKESASSSSCPSSQVLQNLAGPSYRMHPFGRKRGGDYSQSGLIKKQKHESRAPHQRSSSPSFSSAQGRSPQTHYSSSMSSPTSPHLWGPATQCLTKNGNISNEGPVKYLLSASIGASAYEVSHPSNLKKEHPSEYRTLSSAAAPPTSTHHQHFTKKISGKEPSCRAHRALQCQPDEKHGPMKHVP